MATTIKAPAACSRSFQGVPAAIGEARAWATRALPQGCSRVDDVALVVSELATNAILHSASGAPGGRFALQVEVDSDAQSVGVTCIDLGPALVKVPRPAGEGGRGLALVRELADSYEVRAEPTSRTVCCWLDWPADDDNRSGSHGRPPGPVTC
ncbi:ATP-binding protein [Nonomuraea sp. NPDC046802]|uniref:ATP-binding protein n=1 Tax=Nonomuraea sp. NPDC046802 TaxID=3154919 RepID=UPI0033C947EB